MKIVFVCLGNICRSPIAEGILKKHCIENKLNWQIESRGTNKLHTGERPHRLSQKVCFENNIDISNQRATDFCIQDLIDFDKIYVLANDVLNDIKKVCSDKELLSKVDFITNVLYPNQNQDVFDPWYGTEKDYYIVFEEIDNCCDIIIEKYKHIA